MVTRADLDDAHGILSQHFLFWLNEGGNELKLTPGQLAVLRRCFYAGAAAVIDTIDEADTNETAAQALLIMQAEIQAVADELIAANDRYRDDDPPHGTPAA